MKSGELEKQLKECLQELHSVMARDSQFLKKNIEKLINQNINQKNSKHARNLLTKFAESRKRCESRLEKLPRPVFKQSLPVINMLEEIKNTIQGNQVTIIAGETGSGKTTQLPKICLAIGRGVKGYIGHTQPRRIATVTIAERIADELTSKLGHYVGYKIRFQDRLTNSTYVKLMTDGVLLAEIQSDRLLRQYDTLIIDEAHERSLNVDFLLGYLKQILPKRPDLKLVITSATFDIERFSRYFANAPVVEVSGRTYPVETIYLPPERADKDDDSSQTQRSVLLAIEKLSQDDTFSDVLIFLSGEREIRELQRFLKKHLDTTKNRIMPLYSRLNAKDQKKIFEQVNNARKIVLSTNIAETSVTVPGIKYVIDTGLARIKRYSYRNKVQRLPVEKIAQSNANQRKGRCGRVSEGVCIRLYDEDDFNSRPDYPDPEITRVNLASVILQMRALKLGDINDFPFLDCPDQRYIKDGYKLLHELGALDINQKLTEIGRYLARLPVDPKLARMIVAAFRYNASDEVLIIASGLSIQDPRERPADKLLDADEKHNKFADENSDFISLLNLWKHYKQLSTHSSNSKMRKWCRENYISYQRVREWIDIHGQLLELTKELRLYNNKQSQATYEEIHKSLLCGLLGNIGCKKEKHSYDGARQIEFALFPGSGVVKKSPKWIMAAELIETQKLFAHMVAEINPSWLIDIASHLTRHDYSEPHWNKKRGQVMAKEKITLYGLPIAVNRLVAFEDVEPLESRAIFIRSALIAGELDSDVDFYLHNMQMVQEIREEEAKARTTKFMESDETLFAFYDDKLPNTICNRKSLKQWLKQQNNDTLKSLCFTREFLLASNEIEENRNLYPDTVMLNNNEFNLRYNFDIGHKSDGVTIQVPDFLVNQLPDYALEWLVPGLLEEKIVALIRTLPKKYRRNFVPVPDFAKACIEAAIPYSRPLTEFLSEFLNKLTGCKVPAELFNVEQLPQHLLMNVEVVNISGEVIFKGKSLPNRKQIKQSDDGKQLLAVDNSVFIVQSDITSWDFGSLEQERNLEVNGYTIKTFPALQTTGSTCRIKLFEDLVQASHEHKKGVVALFKFVESKKVKYAVSQLPYIDKITIALRKFINRGEVETAVIEKSVELLMFKKISDIRNESQFNSACAYTRSNILNCVNELCQTLYSVSKLYLEIETEIRRINNLALVRSITDIHSQLDTLFYKNFLLQVPYERMKDYIRYLDALKLRIRKLEQSPPKDNQRMDVLSVYWNSYLEMRQYVNDINLNEVKLDNYHWLLQEMRISLFAQEIGTKMSVSNKRLDEMLSQLKLHENKNRN